MTEWNLLSRCERAYEWKYLRPVPGDSARKEFSGERDTDEADSGLLSQRKLGTEVHACLERRDEAGLRELERRAGSARFQAEAVIRWARQSPWMWGAGASGAGHRAWTELAFEVPVSPDAAGAPAVLVGSVDRLVRRELPDGGFEYAIIDFKVTDEPRTFEALEESYGTQMALYALGLRALEPTCRAPRLLLVNLFPGGVTEHELPLRHRERETAELAVRAVRIVEGTAAARAVPGPRCLYCEFRARCPEGSGGSAARFERPLQLNLF